ncbi:hypothetical protein GCM10027610_058340 [Dactylosporangium cerinum]
MWPGLDERAEIAHTARDWLAKLHLVAAGCGVTTVPASLVSAVPAGVRVLTVRDGPQEQRRLLLAHLPHPCRIRPCTSPPLYAPPPSRDRTAGTLMARGGR